MISFLQEDTASISSKSNSLASQQSLQSCEVSSSLSSINSLPPHQTSAATSGPASTQPSPLTPSPPPPRQQQHHHHHAIEQRPPPPDPTQPPPAPAASAVPLQQPDQPPVTTFSRHTSRRVRNAKFSCCHLLADSVGV